MTFTGSEELGFWLRAGFYPVPGVPSPSLRPTPRHSREGGNPDGAALAHEALWSCDVVLARRQTAVWIYQTAWIPAFARMTFTGSAESRYWRRANPTPRHSREGGNPDGVVVLRRGFGHPAIIRKRFRAAVPRPQTAWIPAFARMTFTGSEELGFWLRAGPHSVPAVPSPSLRPTPRHSREGGNPDGVVVLRRGLGHPAIIRKRFRAAVPRPQTAWIPAFARMTFTGSEELGFWLRAGFYPVPGVPSPSLRPTPRHSREGGNPF